MSSPTLLQNVSGNDGNLANALTSVTAGYMAGSVALIVHHPLDSLKVLLQTEGSRAVNSASSASAPNASQPTLTGLTPTTTMVNKASQAVTSALPSTSTTTTNAGATRSVSTITLKSTLPVKSRSIRALYTGVGGPLLTIGAIQSVNFAMYDAFRRYLMYKQNPEREITKNPLTNDPLQNVASASVVTGAFISFLTSPIFVVKTKQQVMLWTMKKAAKDTYRQGGIRNFYTGFGAHFICESLWRGIYFTSYEYLKRCRTEQNLSKCDETLYECLHLSVPERMVCAGAAGMAAWAVIFPFDVVRSKMYAMSALNPTQSHSSLQLTRDLWGQGRFHPFYRGIFITLIRTLPMQMTLLPCYDLALKFLTVTTENHRR